MSDHRRPFTFVLSPQHNPTDAFCCQIFDGATVPQRMVDGWNAFFCDDLNDLVSSTGIVKEICDDP